MKYIQTMISIVFVSLFGWMTAIYKAHAYDNNNSELPIGYWLTVSDTKIDHYGLNDGYVVQSIVKIMPKSGQSDQLIGKILVPFAKIKHGQIVVPDTKCSQCQGNLKNQTIDQLTIIKGVSQSAKANQKQGYGPVFSNGTILNPSNGKVYDVKLWTKNQGQKLEVRGYEGYIFHQTQTWYRINKSTAQTYVKQCGLKNGHYSYANKQGKVIDQKRWHKCSHIKLPE